MRVVVWSMEEEEVVVRKGLMDDEATAAMCREDASEKGWISTEGIRPPA